MDSHQQAVTAVEWAILESWHQVEWLVGRLDDQGAAVECEHLEETQRRLVTLSPPYA